MGVAGAWQGRGVVGREKHLEQEGDTESRREPRGDTEGLGELCRVRGSVMVGRRGKGVAERGGAGMWVVECGVECLLHRICPSPTHKLRRSYAGPTDIAQTLQRTYIRNLQRTCTEPTRSLHRNFKVLAQRRLRNSQSTYAAPTQSPHRADT